MSLKRKFYYETPEDTRCTSPKESDDTQTRCSLVGAFIIIFVIACASFGFLILFLHCQLQRDMQLFAQRATDFKNKIDREMEVLTRRINDSDMKMLVANLRQTESKLADLEKKLKRLNFESQQGLKASVSNMCNRGRMVGFDHEDEAMFDEDDNDADDEEYRESIETEKNESISSKFNNRKPLSPGNFPLPTNDTLVEETSAELYQFESSSISSSGLATSKSASSDSTSTSDYQILTNDNDEYAETILPNTSSFSQAPETFVSRLPKPRISKRNSEFPMSALVNAVTNITTSEKKELQMEEITTNRTVHERVTTASITNSIKRPKPKRYLHELKATHFKSRGTSFKEAVAVGGSELDCAKNCIQAEVEILVAAHFGASDSTFKNRSELNKGNGRFLHISGNYSKWVPSDWHQDYDTEKYLTVVDGSITIQTGGLYFIYAQIIFSDTSSNNGYIIYKNNEEVLQCIMFNPGSSTNKLSAISCYTGGVVNCRAGDSFTIRNNESKRHIVVSSSKSFFGLFKLGQVSSMPE